MISWPREDGFEAIMLTIIHYSPHRRLVASPCHLGYRDQSLSYKSLTHATQGNRALNTNHNDNCGTANRYYLATEPHPDCPLVIRLH